MRSLGPIAALNRWNARHPWSHNDHFHGWILRNLPERRTSALDVGCGRGALLALLAHDFDSVTGIDPDVEMVAAAEARLAGSAEVRRQSLLKSDGEYDLVTMVASLHHVALEPALHHVAGLIAPNGRLLVVGLAQTGSPSDLVYGGASMLLDPVVGFLKHPRALTAPDPGRVVPIRDPDETYDQLRATAQRVLPGARMRRRLFYRYTLCWDR